jgi:hypothetical protein
MTHQNILKTTIKFRCDRTAQTYFAYNRLMGSPYPSPAIVPMPVRSPLPVISPNVLIAPYVLVLRLADDSGSGSSLISASPS